MRRLKKEYIESLLIISFAGVIYYFSSKLPAPPLNKIGPSFFPKLLSIAFAVLAFALLIKGVLSGNDEDIHIDFSFKDPIDRNKIIIPLSLLFYIFLMQYIGFLASTFIFCTSLMILFGTHIYKAAFLSAFLAVVIYYVFIVLMVVPLPIVFSLPKW